MDNTSKMIRLLSLIKSEMNGAVADYMQENGLAYPLSYGVSSATVRSIAKRFAPDHPLAELLYRQQVRELRLAATTIADPHRIRETNLDFWMQGITTIEMAENVGAFLLSGTDIADTIVRSWVDSENDSVRYCALITAVKAISGGKIKDDTVEYVLTAAKDATDIRILRTLGTLLEKYVFSDDAKAKIIKSLIGREDTECYRFLSQELSI